jgi:hypothetical protein
MSYQIKPCEASPKRRIRRLLNPQCRRHQLCRCTTKGLRAVQDLHPVTTIESSDLMISPLPMTDCRPTTTRRSMRCLRVPSRSAQRTFKAQRRTICGGRGACSAGDSAVRWLLASAPRSRLLRGSLPAQRTLRRQWLPSGTAASSRIAPAVGGVATRVSRAVIAAGRHASRVEPDFR